MIVKIYMYIYTYSRFDLMLFKTYNVEYQDNLTLFWTVPIIC